VDIQGKDRRINKCRKKSSRHTPCADRPPLGEWAKHVSYLCDDPKRYADLSEHLSCQSPGRREKNGILIRGNRFRKLHDGSGNNLCRLTRLACRSIQHGQAVPTKRAEMVTKREILSRILAQNLFINNSVERNLFRSNGLKSVLRKTAPLQLCFT